jgi:hypothetical protein
MVHADDPQGIFAAQAFVADEDVLQCIIERMADVQRAGDIRRRIDDREGCRVGTRGRNSPRLSHSWAHFASIAAGSNVFSIGIAERLCQPGWGLASRIGTD